MTDAATVHRAMFDAILTHDLDALRALYHPDYVYTGTDGSEEKGAEAGIAVADAYTTAFPDMTFEIRHHYTPSESVSIIEHTARGTHQGELEGMAPTGRSVTIPGCNVVEVVGGKIYREQDYFDTGALIRQLGALDS